MITLAPFQQEAVDAVVANWMGGDGVMRQIVQMPPGAGKTAVSAAVVRGFMGPSGPFADGRFLFLVHNREIVQQARDTYAEMMPEWADQMGVVQAEQDQFERRFVFASWQTLNRPERLRRYLTLGGASAAQKPTLIVTDEAHHVPSPTYIETLRTLSEGRDRWGQPKPTALTVGITATPNRSDGYSLAMYFERIVYNISLLELIAMGYLCDIERVQVVTDIDLASCRKTGEDYNKGDLERAVAASKDRYDKMFDALQQHAPGKQFICFAASVPDAYVFTKYLNERGVPTGCITAKTRKGEGKEERGGIVASCRSGETRGLCLYGALGEGLDIPAIEVVLMMRHTQSVPLYVQAIGRGNRVLPYERDLPIEQRTKQRCLVLEAAGNDHRMVTLPVMLGKTEREIGHRSVRQAMEDGVLEKPEPRAHREPPGGLGTFYRNAPLFHEYQWTGIGGQSYELRVPGLGKYQAMWDLNSYVVSHVSEGGRVSYLSRVPLAKAEHAFGQAEQHLKTLKAKAEEAEKRRSDPTAKGEPIPYEKYKWMRDRKLYPVPSAKKGWTAGEYQVAMDQLADCKKRGVRWWDSDYFTAWKERHDWAR